MHKHRHRRALFYCPRPFRICKVPSPVFSLPQNSSPRHLQNTPPPNLKNAPFAVKFRISCQITPCAFWNESPFFFASFSKGKKLCTNFSLPKGVPFGGLVSSHYFGPICALGRLARGAAARNGHNATVRSSFGESVWKNWCQFEVQTTKSA